MTPRFDPATYPGARPDGPVLVHRGDVHPVSVDGTSASPVTAAVEARVLEPARVRWCLAYGANACPDRLIDKGLDRRGTLLLPATLVGWVPVFEARRTGYGAVPLTLLPAPGRRLTAWVLGVDADDVDALDRSEGHYVRGRVGTVAVADRFLLPDALAYLPGPDTRVQRHGDGWRTWPEHDQRSAARGLEEEAATHVPAPPTDAPVAGPWPVTPLSDPPLFVYGTLRPRGHAWRLVADLVDDAGPARVPGRLFDTGRGYPAAVLEAADATGEVHGVLVLPRGASAARELLHRVDRYEGCPPYRRVAVRAATAGGWRWALAYTWQDGDPPGRVVPHGRWGATTS